jgi:hypothetical protein
MFSSSPSSLTPELIASSAILHRSLVATLDTIVRADLKAFRDSFFRVLFERSR